MTILQCTEMPHQFDENSNNNETLDIMKFKTSDSYQGRPYNSNRRQILCGHWVGVEHIELQF